MQWLKSHVPSLFQREDGSKRRIKLQSNEGKVFEVSEAVAYQMQVVREMAEEGDFFPLPNVSSKVLAKVIEYCEKHSNGSSRDLEEWDMGFASDGDIVFQLELVTAANYINVESLQKLMCKALAKSLEGRSVEDVRKIFRIENDYTPEEEEAYRNEYKWAFR